MLNDQIIIQQQRNQMEQEERNQPFMFPLEVCL